MTSGADGPLDEFDTIGRLFRPLSEGAPEARGLKDDVAVIPGRPGHELVVTKDAMVEGVHFLPGDPLELVARKLLRVNLSDLYAKGADAYGYLLAVSWSERCGWPEREAFARGLGEDQSHYGVRLFGGDTTSTTGPLSASITAFGWNPVGRTVSRAGAKAGDILMVSGTIGDAGLGLLVARGQSVPLEQGRLEALVRRYRIPEPRMTLARAVREYAAASADVSDGLLADALHIAEASGVGLELSLESIPFSRGVAAWLEHRVDIVTSLIQLATGGDDYEIVCAVRPERAEALAKAAEKHGESFTTIGRFVQGRGLSATFEGEPVPLDQLGWRHR